jgi:LPXTG-motif cell wall-anchored protein
MFRKALILAAFAVTGLLLTAGPAFAAYPPNAPSIGTSSSSVQNAGSTTVMGTGWQAGTTVALTIASTPQSIGTASVRSDGTFSQDVTIPCLNDGTHTISGSGTDAAGAANTASTTITVTGTCGDPAGGGGTLPHTGSNAAGVVTLASGLILLGAVLVIAINRRRSVDV